MTPNGATGTATGASGASNGVAAVPVAIGVLAGLMAGDETRPTPDGAAASTPVAPAIADRLTLPHNGQNLQVFFGNLHSHTSLSDGSGFPEDAYRAAREAGLDFLAVTEHNHDRAENRIEGTPIGERGDGVLIGRDRSLYVGPDDDAVIPAANRMNDDGSFVAIYGQEYSSIGSGNHANVFFPPDVIDAPNGEFDELVEWLDANRDIEGQPPLVQFNHPQLHSGSDEYGRDDFQGGDEAAWRAAMDPLVSLIEIANGPHTGTGTGNTPSTMQGHYLEYLNRGLHLAPTADQDNHERTWGSVTEARTGVIATSPTRGEVIGALRGRHVYATLDRNLQIIATVNGHLMGDVIRTQPQIGDALDILVHVRDADEPDAEYRLDVFEDSGPGGDEAEVVNTFAFRGDTQPGEPFVISDVTYSGPGQYLFLRMRQTEEHGDDDTVWTAPVWFEPSGAGPEPEPAETPNVRVVRLLPNPSGDETQDEEATIRNDGPGPVDLTGWALRDLAGREWSLDALGTIPEGQERTIQRNGQPMAMNNSGQETITLINSTGETSDIVTYTGTMEGQPIRP